MLYFVEGVSVTENRWHDNQRSRHFHSREKDLGNGSSKGQHERVPLPSFAANPVDGPGLTKFQLSLCFTNFVVGVRVWVWVCTHQ